MSMVFQLPHCVEKAAFPLPQNVTGRMKTHWAKHQVQTAVNYSRSNPLLSWFVGGLNLQIEHHLFPRICHVHYAALAPLVEKTCQEYGSDQRSRRISCDPLRQEIKRITGVEVQEALAEVGSTRGAVVQIFTTGTMVQVFQLASSVAADCWSGTGHAKRPSQRRMIHVSAVKEDSRIGRGRRDRRLGSEMHCHRTWDHGCQGASEL